MNLFDVYYENTILDFEQKQYESAIKSADEALKYYKDEYDIVNKIEILEIKARSLYILKDYDNTLEAANELLEIEDNELAYKLKAISLENKSKYEEVIPVLQQMFEYEIGNPFNVLSRMALAYHYIGKYEESISACDKAFDFIDDEAVPDLYDSREKALVLNYNILAKSHEKLGNYDVIEEVYKKILDTLVNEDAYNNLAWFYYKYRQNYELALDNANKALIVNPKHYTSLDTRANIYEALGQYENALEDINLAIEINPKKNYYETRAKIYEKLNEYEKAKLDLEKAAEIK